LEVKWNDINGYWHASEAPVVKSPEQLQEEAEVARDAEAKRVGASKASCVGGYNKVTGQVAAACSGPSADCKDTKCGEDNLVEALGGKPEDVVFTMPVRPRTGKPMGVCVRCQGTYQPGQFPPGTPAEPGGPWGR
jgi:hypothetical protein